ncbi:hypothetical protein N181_23195 [Sinorhizobium fredii USDA 205]|uniref:Uncharacterized protein n=1 Tax=Rhizobium fredii TaxID=380 RepID=A0A844A4I5_RHIFR|nr:hypothetical protein [Sinorhizobium fredii]KSV85568.1 hypothetical protein N181_23195 [Sinorhizobium fredii USDA 205]MQX06795.1 hypothetical protein [Sinorhizobium fredii]GEC34026.1 hypothetical protein EFR01_41970 [Sinorhizobium fredii]GLS06430.1 hypothetical protein GCM10007864_00540 [Sinorhizobium fredii]
MRDFPTIKLDDLQSDYPGVFESARYVDVGIGWLPLIQAFVDEALRHDPSLCVHECKEKWGTLRIWCDTDVLPARLAKAKAEMKSSFTCEVCGGEGYVRRPPPDRMAWWRCLCDEHASPDQRSWPRREPGRMTGMMQTRGGQWYRYDRDLDQMIPSDPPEGWSR